MVYRKGFKIQRIHLFLSIRCCLKIFPYSSALLLPSESAVRFDGKSYLRYLHRMDEDDQDFKLSLRFKTYQEQSLILSSNGTNDWGAIEVKPLKGRRGENTNWWFKGSSGILLLVT